jgi:hypothetical protein
MFHLQSGRRSRRRFCRAQRFSLLVECNEAGYRSLHYCSSEGRDCNQRLITNGCEAAFASHRCRKDVSRRPGWRKKRQAGSFSAPSLFSRPLLLAFNHSHPRPLLKSVDPLQ